MEEYSEEGWTDLVYDNYHALYQREDSRSGGYVEGLDKKIVGDNYIRGLEFAANLSREKGLNFSAVTFQTFGGGVDSYNGNAKYGWRPIDEYDMRYGVYVSLAYVPDYLVWFHYWPSRYTASVISPVSSWMDEWGNKVWYDEGKKLNEEILKYGKVLSNFEFQGVHYYTDARRLPYYYRVDNLYEVKDVNVESINGEMILSELYDAKKGVTGYFITNSKAPYERKGLNATVEFSGKNHAVVYKNGDPEVVTLKNGKLDVDLGCADGILVLPYQI